MGFFIGLVKDTSLAYIVGLHEIDRALKDHRRASSGQPLEIYIFIAFIYFCLCFPLSRLAPVEARVSAQQHRPGARWRRSAGPISKERPMNHT